VLATVDRIADSAEKSRLAADLQTDLVDMEAAALAQIAQVRGVAFSCFKGISDGPADRIPTNPSFVDPNGRLRYGHLIAYAVLHPSQWVNLVRIGQNSGKAARGLKTALQAVMDDAS
jgi:adenosylhomocysteine nucleosidase